MQKVFDELLFRKLYLDRIIENGWLLVRDIYKGMTLSVKWESQLSSPFVIRQEVRQGGVLSTSHYKRYNNPLVIQLEEKYESIQIPHITVADYLALVTDSEYEMQYMLEDSEALQIRTTTLFTRLKVGCGSKLKYDFTMFGKPIKIVEHSTHLGLFRDNKIKANIEENVSLARKTAYSLMGAGLLEMG